MPNKRKAPWFQFYPNDFILDNDLKAMSNETVGMYIKLLCYDWMNDGIPNSEKAIMRLADFDNTDIHGNLREAKEYEALFAQLRVKFVDHPTKMAHLSNPRLIRERKKQKKFTKEKSISGKKGAEARWGKDKVQSKLKKIAGSKQMPQGS